MSEYPDFHGDTPLSHTPKNKDKGHCACGTACHCEEGCDCENCGCLSCSPVQPCGCKWNHCTCEDITDCGPDCKKC